jgi:hypothetical protein
MIPLKKFNSYVETSFESGEKNVELQTSSSGFG